MSRTIQQLAKEAIEVQDACNLSGVIHGMSRAMTDFCELDTVNRGTIHRNQHPLFVLWADKIAHLTGTQTVMSDRVSTAYDWAYRQIESETAVEIEATKTAA